MVPFLSMLWAASISQTGHQLTAGKPDAPSGAALLSASTTTITASVQPVAPAIVQLWYPPPTTTTYTHTVMTKHTP
jgi:hypothetical protein